MKNADDIHPTTSGNYRKQWRKGKVIGDDELVKYMHNLPTYLEKGDNIHENVLNVGVLDWGRLEKWQCKSKQIPVKSSRCSPTSSNASPFFTTDGSSANSSREQSCSPSHQSRHRPTLETHLRAFPKDSYPEGVQFFGGSFENNQDLKPARSNTSKRQPKLPTTDHSSGKNDSAAPVIVPELGVSPNLENFEEKSHSKRKMKIQDGEFTKKAENPHMLNANFSDKDYLKRPETVVLILPKGSTQVSNSRRSSVPGLPNTAVQRSKKATRGSFSGSSYSQGRGSFSESSFPQDNHQAELYSEISHTCTLPHEIDSSKESQLKQHNSRDVPIIGCSTDASPFLPHKTNRLMSPRDKKTKEKPTMMAVNSTANKPSEGPGLQKASAVVPEVRNVSPAHRYGISMGKTNGSSCSKGDLARPDLSANHFTSKSVSERHAISASLDNYRSEKKSASTEARSSPLRRLLDPLVKPRAVNYYNVAEALQEDLTSTERASESSHGRLNSTIAQSVRVKLDLTGCRTAKVINSFQNEKHKSSIVHALLKVAVKNGLPLFTLAVDDESDVIAATRRLSTPRKDDYCWSYTFFTVREIRKKNGNWINKVGKDKRQGYVPNIVAKMKISDSLFSNICNLDAIVEYRMRKFVLCSVDQRQADQQSSSVQPSDELAAIVIKIPRGTAGNDRHNSVNYSGLSEIGFKDILPKGASTVYGQNGLLVGSENPLSMTAILPNGVHSVPTKGEPPSLIERWKSGGSCDCGGWDMGCKLRVLVNENQLFKASSSCSRSDQFDLFCQDDVLEKQPVFSLAPFNDGIYLVEFDTSLSLLQAFSMCVAVLDSRELLALSQHNNSIEETTLEQTIAQETDEIKASDGVQGENYL